MNTIKIEAKNYANKIWCNGRVFLSNKKYSEIDFIAGANLVQQWILVEQKLPPINIRVILKSETGYTECRTIKSYHIKSFADKNELTIKLSGKNVVSWRLIDIE